MEWFNSHLPSKLTHPRGRERGEREGDTGEKRGGVGGKSRRGEIGREGERKKGDGIQVWEGVRERRESEGRK